MSSSNGLPPPAVVSQWIYSLPASALFEIVVDIGSSIPGAADLIRSRCFVRYSLLCYPCAICPLPFLSFPPVSDQNLLILYLFSSPFSSFLLFSVRLWTLDLCF
jgi:ABC-type Na+ efflux pump permease subunit